MTAEVAESIAGVRRWTSAQRRAGRVVGFVPTMGALHAGHAALIEAARGDAAAVIVSIFVNPLQFDRQDDLDRYPRTLDADLRICNELGVELVFAPPTAEMYPRPPSCTVKVTGLTDRLCGAFRPGHFDGVATVVTKLLQIVQPQRAYFGEKDAQQLAVIRRLVADLDMAVEIVGVPTVRESDGLALSSRNARLTAEERALAPLLYRALRLAGDLILEGETSPHAIEAAARAAVPAHPALRLEYLEVVDPLELQPAAAIGDRVLVAGAMWVGGTRLIDNLLVQRRAGRPGETP
jgi:pantoate--beta-alanine ligase